MKNNAIISAFKPVVEAAVARPWIPEGGQFFGPLDTMATEVLVQGKDAKASLDEVAQKYKAEVVPSLRLLTATSGVAVADRGGHPTRTPCEWSGDDAPATA